MTPVGAFREWKKIGSEGEAAGIAETMLRGVCEPARLLDLVENFCLFQEVPAADQADGKTISIWREQRA